MEMSIEKTQKIKFEHILKNISKIPRKNFENIAKISQKYWKIFGKNSKICRIISKKTRNSNRKV